MIKICKLEKLDVRRLGNFVAKVGFEPTSCTFKGCSPALDDLALFSYQGRTRTYILKSRASSPAVRRLGNFVEEVGFEPTLRFLSPLQRRLNCHYSIPQYVVSFGIEPKIRGPKALVLPLHYKTIKNPNQLD
jgi:hypothetical protein